MRVDGVGAVPSPFVLAMPQRPSVPPPPKGAVFPWIVHERVGTGASAVVFRATHVTRGIAAALNPDGLRVVQFNGAPAGQSVFHLHFHVIPVWQGQAQAGHGAGTADPGELQAMARQIAAKLA